ncbi:MAG: deoxyguanosinetriphosphate triphosphohydrolase [Fimbriimonadaceae bacterium]|nr:deoxyguanosinetriphosphate triphosphohydrolase [Fimbriimonadaceae bacterium]
MTIRQRLEQQEAATLSPLAARAVESRGRQVAEAACPTRTCFMRDRDRIIHQAKAFRRLAHKTQVFVSPREDHYRTRLSHTLEVAQIARTLAKALRLNEDLTEAIALAHDLGHPPFGHAGEEGLDETLTRLGQPGGFHHALHSLRVVDRLERDGHGLNLTWEVRNGIVAHSKGRQSLDAALAREPATLEAALVKVSDRIAYLNHDIDDAIRAGVLRVDDLPADALGVLGRSHGERVDRMVADVLASSLEQPRISLSAEVAAATEAIKEYLYDEVYLNARAANADRASIKRLMAELVGHFLEQPDKLGAHHPALDLADPADRLRAVTDWVAGMTDRYAKQTYIDAFLPHDWHSPDQDPRG